MIRKQQLNLAEIAKSGVLIGLAGGFAEVVWIAFYGLLAGADTTEVARTITSAVAWLSPLGWFAALPVISGIVIHMIASIGLGFALAFVWFRMAWIRSGATHKLAFMVGTLTLVWSFNFLIVLPLISPGFIDLHQAFIEIVPYSVSLVSKILFGLAGGIMLQHCASGRYASSHLHVTPS